MGVEILAILIFCYWDFRTLPQSWLHLHRGMSERAQMFEEECAEHDGHDQAKHGPRQVAE